MISWTLWTLLYSSGEYWYLFQYAAKFGWIKLQTLVSWATSPILVHFFYLSFMHMYSQRLNRDVYREYIHRIPGSHSLDLSSPGFFLLLVEWLWLTQILSSYKFSMKVLANLPGANFRPSSD